MKLQSQELVKTDLAACTNLQCIATSGGVLTTAACNSGNFLGLQSETLIGKSFYQLIDLPFQNTLKDNITALEVNNTYTARVVVNGKAGRKEWAEIMATRFGAQEAGIFINCRILYGHADKEGIEQQIKAAHAHFFSRHPWGVFHLTTKGRVDIINPRLTLDLGYTLADVQSRNLLDFFLPQYKRKVFLMYHNAVHKNEGDTYDVKVYTAAGKTLDVNLSIIPVVYEEQTLEIYGIIKDISDRKELQQTLMRTSIVADRSLNGVLILNKDRKIEWVNKGFTLMNGYTLDEAVGQDPSVLLRVEGATGEVINRVTESVMAGNVVKSELQCYKKDGTSYWVIVELTPVFSKSGKLEQMISVHTDITDLKKAGDDLKQLTEDLYRQNKELYQFAYIVSHDLRAPVASIVGLANLLEVYKNDEETLSDGLKDLVKAAHNLDEVIHDLSHILEVTNNGAKQLFKEDIDVHEVLTQIITNLHEVIIRSNTNISMPQGHCFVYTNKAYLHSIFYNLLSNAIKYRSEKPPQINISYQCVDEQIVFTVSDNGMGIDLSKHADAVFKPYRRFTNLREGKGLGLFLVKSHVEALGGSISLTSEPGKGSTFEFSISTGK